jgi:hypothetical protein
MERGLQLQVVFRTSVASLLIRQSCRDGKKKRKTGTCRGRCFALQGTSSNPTEVFSLVYASTEETTHYIVRR